MKVRLIEEDRPLVITVEDEKGTRSDLVICEMENQQGKRGLALMSYQSGKVMAEAIESNKPVKNVVFEIETISNPALLEIVGEYTEYVF